MRGKHIGNYTDIPYLLRAVHRRQLSGYYGILVHAYNSLCGMVLYSNLTIPRITDVKKFSHYLG